MTDLPDKSILDQSARESGLAELYASDPSMLEFYKKKLLIWGWSGPRDPVEDAYIKAARRLMGKGQSEKQVLARNLLHDRQAATRLQDNTGEPVGCSQTQEPPKAGGSPVLSVKTRGGETDARVIR
jgi:hypothetical protein